MSRVDLHDPWMMIIHLDCTLTLFVGWKFLHVISNQLTCYSHMNVSTVRILFHASIWEKLPPYLSHVNMQQAYT